MIFFNHVNINMFRELGCGLIVGLVSSHVCGVMLVEILGFVNTLIED